MLEEVQLQDNRLEIIHPAFFSTLKSLTSLDLSNNKLLSLPYELWSASKLKELNVSFNLLSELPMSDLVKNDDFDSDSVSSDNISATDIGKLKFLLFIFLSFLVSILLGQISSLIKINFKIPWMQGSKT